jgi:hypothetical protein
MVLHDQEVITSLKDNKIRDQDETGSYSICVRSSYVAISHSSPDHDHVPSFGVSAFE